MGAFLERPECSKDTASATSKELGLEVALSAMQGWRVDMEDAHTVRLTLDDAKDYAWFAVFDGHGGSLVSTTSAAQVLGKITSTPFWKADNRSIESISKALRKGFLDMDDDLRKLPDVLRGDDHSGSTAIGALVTPTHLIVANVGDSRCILVKRSGSAGGPPEAVEMSYDHKPYLDNEMKRITNAGGTVTMRRVNGDLAVSRALGDFVYKHRRDLPAEEQQVSAEPEIIARERTKEDQYLVLACDGIWDVMNNQEVADFFASHPGGNTTDLERTCEALLDECLSRGSRDNMSVVVVSFINNNAAAAAATTGGAARPAAASSAAAAPAASSSSSSAAAPSSAAETSSTGSSAMAVDQPHPRQQEAGAASNAQAAAADAGSGGATTTVVTSTGSATTTTSAGAGADDSK